MRKSLVPVPAFALAAAALCAGNAHAFRMIQNTSVGRTSSAVRVTCDDAGGFAHWATSSMSWRLNPANQGGTAGVAAAVQHGMASWTNVSPATYTLSYAGTTTNGFATDGVNTLLWTSGNGCTGGCLAITALVLAAGQVITEADVSFNNSVSWSTGGSDYDVEAVATHELGHSMGIHHTDVQRTHGRPTMYATYFGTGGRSLESDDADALNCAYTRYPPPGANLVYGGAAAPTAQASAAAAVRLAARPRAGGAIIRFALTADSPVRLEVFDVAGRRLATLVDAFEAAGEHEIAWDGATSNGHVASGFYFARITSAEGRATTTVPLAE